MSRRWTAHLFASALALGGLASAVGGCGEGCGEDPCESLCERQRAEGCVVLTYLQLPCEEQCSGARGVAKDSGCAAELEAYYACAADLDEVCGEALSDACGAENQAYAACRMTSE